MKPLLGIACDVRPGPRNLAFVFENYIRCVENAGGVPVLLPPLVDPAPAADILRRLDGVLFVGGEDIDPGVYGEEPLPGYEPVPPHRGTFDLELARCALNSDLPILAVCYGAQLLAVVTGGTLWQHLPDQLPDGLEHRGKYPDLPLHPVTLEPGTRLSRIFGTAAGEVNTSHHQGIRTLGEDWIVSAASPDGVIEGFERPGDRFVVGVQWHPELMETRPEQRALFEAFVEAASSRDQ